jgi:threonine-phosphate decarboxylase
MLLSPQIEVLPTKTHFMLGRLSEGNVKEMKDYLAREYGILIRDASNFVGLDEHYFRIATQTRGENEILIKAITKWLHLVSH